MSVANIFNIPSNDTELARWSALHMFWHRSVNREILARYNVLLPEFIIDPADFSTQTDFLQTHQTMHNNNDSILGISPYNLLDVDMSDPNQRAGWFALHAELTRSESNALGIFS